MMPKAISEVSSGLYKLKVCFKYKPGGTACIPPVLGRPLPVPPRRLFFMMLSSSSLAVLSASTCTFNSSDSTFKRAFSPVKLSERFAMSLTACWRSVAFLAKASRSVVRRLVFSDSVSKLRLSLSNSILISLLSRALASCNSKFCIFFLPSSRCWFNSFTLMPFKSSKMPSTASQNWCSSVSPSTCFAKRSTVSTFIMASNNCIISRGSFSARFGSKAARPDSRSRMSTRFSSLFTSSWLFLSRSSSSIVASWTCRSSSWALRVSNWPASNMLVSRTVYSLPILFAKLCRYSCSFSDASSL
mmetsp:Transcript_72460/g.209776  ORF Transcript_72460/g.209776 Transcript_72460/m.209776 type:complete len:301 (-) Transcript_72460:476-1378(-)